MKNRVLLLNYQERKGFEETYQSLANCPEWQMENVFIHETIERKQFNRLPHFDLPPVFHLRKRPNRLTLAAHESGHAIVMEATHCRTVGKVSIDLVDHPEGFLGFVEPQGRNKEASDHPPAEQEGVMPCKPMMIIDILIDAAGFIGESFVGKKTGSNHEKFLIYCRCRHLDDLNEVEPLTNWTHYVEWCRNIIFNNESLFWRVIDDLLANSELTESVKIALHRSIKKEPTELFF